MKKIPEVVGFLFQDQSTTDNIRFVPKSREIVFLPYFAHKYSTNREIYNQPVNTESWIRTLIVHFIFRGKYYIVNRTKSKLARIKDITKLYHFYQIMKLMLENNWYSKDFVASTSM